MYRDDKNDGQGDQGMGLSKCSHFVDYRAFKASHFSPNGPYFQYKLSHNGQSWRKGQFLYLKLTYGCVELSYRQKPNYTKNLGTTSAIKKLKGSCICDSYIHTIEIVTRLDQLTLTVDGESQTAKLDSPLVFSTDYYFAGIPKYVKLSSIVYGSMFDNARFTGILRTFKVDGLAKYPDYRPDDTKCVRKVAQGESCDVSICRNGGVCRLGVPPTCDCSLTKPAFTGRFCEISKWSNK